ncbi:MAG: type IX secretion system membrane protein PorP/SprF [Bacteroidales bacterium]
MLELAINYRNQWPSLAGNFTTYNASVDHYIRAISGGVGLIVLSDNKEKE